MGSRSSTIRAADASTDDNIDTLESGPLYIHMDMHGQFGCDSDNPHMVERDGTEWSCPTCHEQPLREMTSGMDAEIIACGFDVCNECKPTVQHEHELVQGWKKGK